MTGFRLFFRKEDFIAVISFQQFIFLVFYSPLLFLDWRGLIGSNFTYFFVGLLRIVHAYFLITSKALDRWIKLRLNTRELVVVLGATCPRLLQTTIVLNIENTQRRRVSIASDFPVFFIHHLHVLAGKRTASSCRILLLEFMRNL